MLVWYPFARWLCTQADFYAACSPTLHSHTAVHLPADRPKGLCWRGAWVSFIMLITHDCIIYAIICMQLLDCSYMNDDASDQHWVTHDTVGTSDLTVASLHSLQKSVKDSSILRLSRVCSDQGLGQFWRADSVNNCVHSLVIDRDTEVLACRVACNNVTSTYVPTWDEASCYHLHQRDESWKLKNGCEKQHGSTGPAEGMHVVWHAMSDQEMHLGCMLVSGY